MVKMTDAGWIVQTHGAGASIFTNTAAVYNQSTIAALKLKVCHARGGLGRYGGCTAAISVFDSTSNSKFNHYSNCSCVLDTFRFANTILDKSKECKSSASPLRDLLQCGPQLRVGRHPPGRNKVPDVGKVLPRPLHRPRAPVAEVLHCHPLEGGRDVCPHLQGKFTFTGPAMVALRGLVMF